MKDGGGRKSAVQNFSSEPMIRSMEMFRSTALGISHVSSMNYYQISRAHGLHLRDQRGTACLEDVEGYDWPRMDVDAISSLEICTCLRGNSSNGLQKLQRLLMSCAICWNLQAFE